MKPSRICLSTNNTDYEVGVFFLLLGLVVNVDVDVGEMTAGSLYYPLLVIDKELGHAGRTGRHPFKRPAHLNGGSESQFRPDRTDMSVSGCARHSRALDRFDEQERSERRGVGIKNDLMLPLGGRLRAVRDVGDARLEPPRTQPELQC